MEGTELRSREGNELRMQFAKELANCTNARITNLTNYACCWQEMESDINDIGIGGEG